MFEKLVMPAPVDPILVQIPAPVADRSMEYDDSSATSDHVRLICVSDAATAVRPLGVPGKTIGTAGVVALAVLL